jgi:glycerate-2-kinase
MLRGTCAVLQTHIAAVIATHAGGEVDTPVPIEFVPGAHPLPDERSVRAARRALEVAADAREKGELLLVLLSGGGSAMLAAPAAGVTLHDKRTTIESLLRAGADIGQLNCVRKHLSAVKGGRLAAAAGRSFTLALSDVHTPEDDPATIASGPTAADPTTFADAIAVLAALGCAVPPAVMAHLERGAAAAIDETPKPGDARLRAADYLVIGNRRTAMAGAAREGERRGYRIRIIDPPTRGEAREAGRRFAEMALAMDPAGGPLCVIGSGEPTVTVRGTGRGGRNQEFALAGADPLSRAGRPAVLASVGTDGIDGPTDAAGAFVSPSTQGRLRGLGLDIDTVLATNDAYPALARLDQLVKWGPTGTNVGDVHVVLTMGA